MGFFCTIINGLDKVQVYNLWTETFGSLLCDGQQWQQVHRGEDQPGGRATTRKWPQQQKQWKNNPGFWSFENMKWQRVPFVWGIDVVPGWHCAPSRGWSSSQDQMPKLGQGERRNGDRRQGGGGGDSVLRSVEHLNVWREPLSSNHPLLLSHSQRQEFYQAYINSQ